MSDARSQIIETASQLLEQQGYHATGLSQIVEESGAPKGSLYYYFPEGKKEISEEALRKTGRRVESNIRKIMASSESASAGIRTLIYTIADRIEESEYRAGGPITTVALETASGKSRLNRACGEIYDEWHEVLRERMVDDDIEAPRADRLATTVLSAIEGAMVLARTHRSRGPLENVAKSLSELIEVST